ncbi:MAG: VWA domain-containing protein, partial [Phycisphaeraceae bacterium]
MTDHTPQHDDALVTAYALGELDPQSDDYQSIAAKAADDAALHDQIEQIAALGDRLTQSYAQAAGPGLDDAALAAVVDSATAPIARIRPRPTLTRRLLPYAGVAACAALATAGALLAIQSAGVAPSNQTQTTPNDRLAPGDTAVATLDPDDRNDDAQPTLPIAPKPLTPAQQLAAKLDAPLDIDIEKATLSAFFDLIRDETETNFVVNWPALELVGIDRDSPLTMQFKNVPARAAIDLALQQVSADAFDDDKAGLRITEHFVEVSTRRDLKTDVETRVYDMDDLLTKGTVLARLKHQLAERLALAKPTPGGSLFGDDSGSGLFADSDGFEPLAPLSVEGVPNADPASKLNTPGDSLYGRGLPRVDIPDFTTVPGFDLNDSLSGTNSGGSTGGSGGSLFGDSDDRDADYDYAEDLPSRQEIVDQYVELIQSTVGDPDEWLDEESTLTEIAGRFVIKTTPENHEQIDRLLGILRPEKKVEAEQDEVLDGVADALIADIELGMLAVEQRRELRAIERERRERFADLTDNPFKLVANEPLSTFSVDVDTASYTYSRRSILTEDTLPNPDAVRIEEWINYFDYGYAAPTVDLDRLDSGRLTTAALQRIEADDASFVPFATDVEVVASPWTEGNQLVRVGLKAMEVDRSNRPPAHLVFLLDVSGSMDRDDKLGLVKKGMPMLL